MIEGLPTLASLKNFAITVRLNITQELLPGLSSVKKEAKHLLS